MKKDRFGLDNVSLNALTFTKRVLLLVLEGVGGYFEAIYDLHEFRSAYVRGGWDNVRVVKRVLECKEMHRAMYQLRKRKYLKWKRRGDSIICSLTKRGVIEAMKAQIRTANDYPDGIICLVTFDVPERQRIARQRLRNFLRGCGFTRKQWSVWTTHKMVHEQITLLAKQMRIGDWIQVYVGELVS